ERRELRAFPTRRSSDLYEVQGVTGRASWRRGGNRDQNHRTGVVASRGSPMSGPAQKEQAAALAVEGLSLSFGGLKALTDVSFDRSEEHTSELQSRENLV